MARCDGVRRVICFDLRRWRKSPLRLQVLQEWRDGRWSGEGLGDWWQRRTGRTAPRTILTGDKTPVDLTVDGTAIDDRFREKAS